MLNFNKNHQSFQLRNEIIHSSLGGNKRILDVGSNNGLTSNFLAQNGHKTVGLEIGRKEHEKAIAASHENSTFHNIPVSKEFLEENEDWDAILLLSVLHRIYAILGEEEMENILHECGKNSNTLFIEGSTRWARYTDQGQEPPGFEDLNVEACIAWHKALFAKTLSDAWDITSIHTLQCSKKEPFRVLFVLKKSPATLK